MLAVPIIAGIVAFLVVASFVGVAVLRNNEAGFLYGLIAAVWAAWPCWKGHQIERYNTLKPVPKSYKLPFKQVFAGVRDILATSTYQFGNKWHVSIADTQARRIVATLNFMEEEGKWEGSGHGGIDYHTKRVQRLVEMEIQFKDNDESCIVQLDFDTKAEGVNAIYGCDEVVNGIKNAIDSRFGTGETVGDAAQFTWSAPPWWLLGITAVGLILLWQDVMKSVFSK